jgi:acyl carrier protein
VPLPTRPEIRALLAAHAPAGTAALGDDEALHLDSLALTWLLHVLDERHGVRIGADDPRLAEFDSIAGIERAVAAIAAAPEPA